MSEKGTLKEEEEKTSDPTLEIEDLDATDATDVKGGTIKQKPIEIESWSW